MDYGIILFVYNRPEPAKKVLEALKRNKVKELYVYQDGLSQNINKKDWEDMAEVIQKIDWCKVNFEQSKEWRGVDLQMSSRITKTLEKKDAVIVLEDDTLICDDYIEFIDNGLIKYKDNKNVMEVSGFLEPINIPEDYHCPVLASRTLGGWGFGIWKDRWEEFCKDYDLIRRIGCAFKDTDRFNNWNRSVYIGLDGAKKIFSFDTLYALNMLEKNGYSIRPTYNKLKNIGFEYAGVHCSGNSGYVVPIAEGPKIEMTDLPDNIEPELWMEKEMKHFFDNEVGKNLAEIQGYYRRCLEKWIAIKQKGKSITDILVEQGIQSIVVYGTGSIAELLIDDIDERVTVEYILVTSKSIDTFRGYAVYEEILDHETVLNQALVMIPGFDKEKIMRTRNLDAFSKVWAIDELMERYR